MTTGIPYLGSKISLISKSEIRYEGILYTIDTKESTVALAKVRSYGTEDRPTDRPVAPRDETYEYIIFRGADIKDIRVCQPPKPRPTLEGGLPNDPAIVQHSRGPPGSAPEPGQAPGPGGGEGGAPGSKPTSYGPIGSSAGAGAASAPAGGASAAAAGNAMGFSAAPGAGAPQANHATNGSPVMDLLKDGQSGASSPAVGGGTGGGAPSAGGRPSSRTSGDGRRGRGGHRGGGRGGGQRGGGQMHGGAGQYGGGGGRGGSNNRGGRGGQHFQPGRPSQSKKDTLKFDSEYDFETANEEFKEILSKFDKVTVDDASESSKVVEAVAAAAAATDEMLEDGEIADDVISKTPSVDGTAAAGAPPPCYDKAKSFFDSISCEAIERSRGRPNKPDWKAEKQLNRETFGTTGFNRRNYNPNYRGGRGGGGYGGHRNYGGGYNNHQGGQQGQQHHRGGYGGGGYNNRYNGRGRGGGGGNPWNNAPNGGGRGGRGGRGGGGPARAWGDVRDQ